MDMNPLPEVALPLGRSTLHKKVVALVGMAILICLVAAITFASHPQHHQAALSSANALTQQVALRQAMVAPAPDPDAWDEKRDGNGALDIEDTNGEGTIFVDKPTQTRILCVSGSSCIVLPNPKPLPTANPKGKTPAKP